MFRKTVVLFALTALLFGCKNEPTGENLPVDANAPVLPANASPADQLKAAALDENDIIGRVRQSFIPLQEEYRRAKGKVPGIGDVTVLVDEAFNLSIENKVDGATILTKVNLKDLNNEQGGMMLLPDRAAGEFPGLKVFTKGNKKTVQVLKNGQLDAELDALEIHLADRPAIERITPAVLQGMNVASGNMPE